MAKTVAIVVRDQNLRTKIAQLIGNAGGRVLESDSGTDALNWAQDRSADLVVIDLHLEETHGDEVCKDIKGLEETADVPVLLLLEEDDEWFRDRAADARADASLTYAEISKIPSVAGKLLHVETRVQPTDATLHYYMVEDSNKTLHKAEILDLSAGGLAFWVKSCELEPDFLIDVRLKLGREPAFLGRARVVRLNPARGGYQVHLAWKGFRTGDRERLVAWIRKHAPNPDPQGQPVKV